MATLTGAAVTAVVLVATAMEAVATATADTDLAAQVNVLICAAVVVGCILKVTRT